MPEAPTQAGPLSVAALIEALAADAGDRAALLRSDGSSLSRSELARRTRLLAQRLRALGIAPTDRVAVIAPNGIDMALAVLGTMRAAACAPLNPQYGQAELAFYLDDLAARALVVTADSPALAREIAAQRGLPVVEAGEAMWATGDAPLPPTPAPDDIALVLHTSGTTSRPKQVPLSHANLAASMAHIVATLHLGADDCALNAMPLFHIHGLVAGLLGGANAPLRWPVLVPIRPAAQRRPLFCVHTIGGNLFHYCELAKALPEGQPVVGLNAVGVGGAEPARSRIADIAADCIGALELPPDDLPRPCRPVRRRRVSSESECALPRLVEPRHRVAGAAPGGRQPRPDGEAAARARNRADAAVETG